MAPGRAGKYPPLLAALVLGLAAVLALPSKFTLPAAPTGETRELAPLVPSDERPDPPPDANLASVSLGSSPAVKSGGAGGGRGAGGGGLAGAQPLVPGFAAAGRNPSTKRCVGNPPRQTEDTIAPPCVPFFNGNNGGATYQGVTRDEIKLLVYLEGGGKWGDGTTSPSADYVDLFDAPSDDENPETRGFRAWQRYFNDRFQTYNRLVHFILYFDDGEGRRSPEARRADAADNYERVKPFAVLTSVRGNEDDYLRAMARYGVLNFGSFAQKPAAFYREFPSLIWSYLPSVEQQVDQYVSYVCSKVVGKDSVMAGPDLNGRPRKLGIVHTSDTRWEGLVLTAELVRDQVEACGGTIEAEAAFPECCRAQDNGDTGTYGQEAMADFKTKGITTILWPGGINGNFAKWAASFGYYPEWILMGDGQLDANSPIGVFSQSSATFDDRAVVVTPQTFLPAFREQQCYKAYREADETLDDSWMKWPCENYRNLVQIFTGIQVAGPHLTPESIDEGFHAIPRIQSTDVQTPSCYYDVGDYTCVKDGIHEVWRADQVAPGQQNPGCWAVIDGGKRYVAGRWPEGNIDAQITGDEPCNGYDALTEIGVA